MPRPRGAELYGKRSLRRSLNRFSPQYTGLRGVWVWDSAAGPQPDATGRNAPLGPVSTASQRPTTLTDPVFGRVGKFSSASSQYAEVTAGSGLNVSLNQTLTIWFQYTSLGSDAFHGIIAKREDGGLSQFGINYRPGGTNLWQVYYRSFATFRTLSVPLTTHFTTGVWYHIAATFVAGPSTTDLTLYKNGVAIAGPSTQTDSMFPCAANVCVGRSSAELGGIEYSDILVKEWRLYDHAVSPAVIWQMYDPKTRWQLYEQQPRNRLARIVSVPRVMGHRRSGTEASGEPAAEYVW